MTIQPLKRIPFYDDTLFLTEHEGEPFTPVRPIIESMGINWPTQYRKLVTARQRWRVVEMTIPLAGGCQRMSCMPVRKLPAFLATIHANKVRPDIRDKIIRYQNECDDVLWQHWSEQHRVKETPTLANSRWLLEFDDAAQHSIKRLDENHRVVDAEALSRTWLFVRRCIKYSNDAVIEADQQMQLTLLKHYM